MIKFWLHRDGRPQSPETLATWRMIAEGITFCNFHEITEHADVQTEIGITDGGLQKYENCCSHDNAVIDTAPPTAPRFLRGTIA